MDRKGLFLERHSVILPRPVLKEMQGSIALVALVMFIGCSDVREEEELSVQEEQLGDEPAGAFERPGRGDIDEAVSGVWFVFFIAAAGLAVFFILAYYFYTPSSFSEVEQPTVVVRKKGFKPQPRAPKESTSTRYELLDDSDD